MYAEDGFHLYMHPIRTAPVPASAPADRNDSVERTRIDAADHDDVVGTRAVSQSP